MSTYNKIKLQEVIQKYTETNHVKFENGQLTILEDDKEKLLTIMWELAEYSPQIASQMFGGKS